MTLQSKTDLTATLTRAALISAALVVTGCSAADGTRMAENDTAGDMRADHNHTTLSDDVMSTVKPGAALQFSSSIDGVLSAGSFTDVVVTITPDETSGLLQATASGTEGLDVLDSHARLTHDMADGAVAWRIPVRPADDGRHYLNIMATTSSADHLQGSARSFSVAIDPGGESKLADDAMKAAVMQDASGDRLAVMDAEETIAPAGD